MTDRTMVEGPTAEPAVLRVLLAIHGDESDDGDEPDYRGSGSGVAVTASFAPDSWGGDRSRRSSDSDLPLPLPLG